MSRIDSHIRTVRNKLALGTFLSAWAQALLVASLVSLAYVLMRQFTLLKLPNEMMWLIGLIAATLIYGVAVAIARRPDELTAAVAIDDRLKLSEKFSTALHARRQDDSFSRAALQDAEQTAARVDLGKSFPLAFPRALIHTLIIGCVAAALVLAVQPRNLFASDAPKPLPKKPDEKKQEEAKKVVKETL
ncbi:MAG TPA: hypothetical protein VGB55_04725, partial [Tepidisphaeraceae bacterium]